MQKLSRRLLSHKSFLAKFVGPVPVVICLSPCLLIGAVGSAASVHDGPKENALQPLTVSDSIEMTRFVDPLEMPGASPKYSPDKKKFLVVTERGRLDLNVRVFELLVFRTERLTEKPTKVAEFQSSSNRDGISQAKWLDNDTIGLIGEHPGELPQVYVVHCVDGRTEKLTADEHGVVSYDIAKDRSKVVYYAPWGGDEKENEYKERHGFAITDEPLVDLVTGQWKTGGDGSYTFQLHLKDLESGKSRVANSGPIQGQTPPVHLSPDGRYAVTVQPPFDVPEYWQNYDYPWFSLTARGNHGPQPWLRNYPFGQYMLFDTKSGDLKTLMEGPESGGDAVWSADSRSVVVCCEVYLPLNTIDPDELARRKARRVLAEVDVATRAVRRLAEAPDDQYWTMEPGEAPDTFRVVARDFHLDQVGKVVSVMNFRRVFGVWQQQDSIQATEDHTRNITIAESVNDWPKLVTVDSDAHRDTVILDPNPQFKTYRFGRAETITWTGPQGERLTGGLYYPADYTPGRRYPLVFQTHGYSSDYFRMDGSFTTANAARALAAKGIAVLQIGDSPLADPQENTLDRGTAMQSQFESGIDYLERIGLIDRERVGLIGFSSTAFDVRYVLMHSQYHFAAATVAEGIDYGYWTYVASAANKDFASSDETPYGGPPWTNWRPWIENSITFNLDKMKTPVLLQSMSNPGAELRLWENFVALRRLNRPVEFIFIPHGTHVLVKPWERMTSQQGTVDWMRFWLKGEEDPDPVKVGQYQRWRELRKLQEQDEAKTKQQSAN